jgi:octaprenyl-diphosphate synthase
MVEAVEKCMLFWIEEVANDDVCALFKQLPKGKRLRAKLVLKIAGESEEALKLAAVIELIHAASLLHDDVIDEASTRRGSVSVNASDGSKIAVMMGDILYSKAYTELVDFDIVIAQAIAKAVTTLSIGEYIDVKMGEAFNADAKAYIDMIYKKTASLIEATAYAAALLAGKEAQAYALYGKNLGLSFQIIDDILDIISDEKSLGKPALNDYKEGKTTLPYIYLYDALDESSRERLKNAHGRVLDVDEALWIKEQMKKHSCVERAYALAQTLSNEAISAVSHYDETALVGIIDDMMKREF